MKKPALIWVDRLVSSRPTEVPEILIDKFSIKSLTEIRGLIRLVEDDQPACIFFDFDYPDQRRLFEFADIKANFSSVPVVMMTLQHSESLAIWAYRLGVLDYLVKPVSPGELRSCVGRILESAALQPSQRSRSASLFRPPIPSEIPITSRSKKDRLSPAIFFVQQHYAERINSDAMARLCGISATHFSRAFKQAYDLTFQEFLLRYRVREACQQLRCPDANIANIAYNVGFSDPSYFTRVFKRYLGAVPSDFAAANDDRVQEDAVANNADDRMTSSSQVVRRLSRSFSP